MKTEKVTLTRSRAAGFSFFIPRPETIQEAVSSWGEDKVLDLILSSVESKIRSKAMNRLGLSEVKPQDVESHLSSMRAKTGGILFTEKEAENWSPEDRSLSPTGLVKKISQLVKEGKKEEARRLVELLNSQIEQVVQ
jgi:hypothetical protein